MTATAYPRRLLALASTSQRHAAAHYEAARSDQHALAYYSFASGAVHHLFVERATSHQINAAMWARQDRLLRGLEG